MSLTIKTDKRGVEYVEDASYDDLRYLLPAGWALCGTCDRAWNDAKVTSVTPTPAARCPFEAKHD